MANRSDKTAGALRRLEELAKKNASIGSDSLALDLSKAPERWDQAIRALGRKPAYEALARYLCREFRLKNGREFLFTEECVAYELGYHINAYLNVLGYRGYPRHVTTYAFSKAALDRHCRSVEIDEKDLNNFKQRVVFRYKRGLRGPAPDRKKHTPELCEK